MQDPLRFAPGDQTCSEATFRAVIERVFSIIHGNVSQRNDVNKFGD